MQIIVCTFCTEYLIIEMCLYIIHRVDNMLNKNVLDIFEMKWTKIIYFQKTRPTYRSTF